MQIDLQYSNSPNYHSALHEFTWRYVNVLSGCLKATKQEPSLNNIQYYIKHLDSFYVEFITSILKDKLSDLDDQVTQYINLVSNDTQKKIKGCSVEASAYYFLFLDCERRFNFTEEEVAIARSFNKVLVLDKRYVSKLIDSLKPFLHRKTVENNQEN